MSTCTSVIQDVTFQTNIAFDNIEVIGCPFILKNLFFDKYFPFCKQPTTTTECCRLADSATTTDCNDQLPTTTTECFQLVDPTQTTT